MKVARVKPKSISAGRLISCLMAILLLGSCAHGRSGYDRVVDIRRGSTQPAASTAFQTISVSPLRSHGNPWLSYTNTNDVTHIALDRRGIVWAAGPGGVVRWDPVRRDYQAFTTSDGLPGNYITALAISPDERVWVGTQAGQVAQYDGLAWTAYDPGVGSTVSCLAVASNGMVWVGTDQGLATFDGKNNWDTAPVPKMPDHYIHSLAVTSSGSVWAGVLGGAVYYDGKKWNTKLLEKGERISVIVEAPDKTLWFGSITALIHFDGSRWSAYRITGDLQDLSGMAIDKKGQIWVADLQSGIARFDENKLELAEYTLPNITSLAFGEAGDLWLGSFQGGIGRFDVETNSFNAVVAENEPVGNLILSGAVASDGSIWIGTDRGASRFDGESWQSFTTADGLIDDSVLSISPALDGSMVLGTGKGLSIFDGLSWRNVPNNGLVSQPLDHLAVAQDGSVWIINRQSLFQLAGGGWNLIGLPFYYASESLQAVAPGVGAGIWLASTNGLWVFENQKWVSFSLPSGAVPSSVVQSGDQDVWVYAKGTGLIQIHGPLWDQINANDVQTVSLDENGQVQAVTVSAVNISLQDISWRVYGEAEGVPVNDVGFLITNGVDGRVWLVNGQEILGLEEDKWIDRIGPVNSNAGFTTVLVDSRGLFWISAPSVEGILKYSP
jgi:ligand-binding sensor domain-containing protein